jgi:hypothetical protein
MRDLATIGSLTMVECRAGLKIAHAGSGSGSGKQCGGGPDRAGSRQGDQFKESAP